MNAHLTRRGIWLLATGLLFLLIGTMASRPLILWMGQLQVMVLALGYGFSVAAGLIVDRRFVHLSLGETESDGSDGGGHSGHVVGDPLAAELAIENRSALPLFDFTADPYGPPQVEVDKPADVPRLAAGGRVDRSVEVHATGSGRWMLQGFDIGFSDPLGLVRVRDYLPCNYAFEFYPSVGRLRRRQPRQMRRDQSPDQEGGRQVTTTSSGTIIHELRDYQPGDPLRHVAWKASARKRKLISRDFEEEITLGTMVLLDISGSMRGGQWEGQKLEHGVELSAGIADALIQANQRVGLLTFDEKVYGYVSPGRSRAHYRRILHHLIGLNSVVDPELTELDEQEIRNLLADYLLVQERLDFRKDDGSGGEAVDEALLRRWITARLEEERGRFHSPVLRDGVVDRELDPVREFVQLRGLPVPYRVESRLGPKGRGMAQAFERLVHEVQRRQHIVVISDLCGVNNLEVLERGLALARHHGHAVRFLVPFTPSYHQGREGESEKRQILMELFTASEREQRLESVNFLRQRGFPVEFIGRD